MLASDFSPEELIFQLTNVGGASTPVRATNLSNSTTPGSVGSHKWARRFTKFSRSKKTFPSPEDESSFPKPRNIHLMAPESKPSRVGLAAPRSASTGHMDLPLRSASIPRPDSQIILPSNHVKVSASKCLTTPDSLPSPRQTRSSDDPPLVQPFEYSPSSMRKKSYVNGLCCLCDERISWRAFGEKVITLSCEHLVHEGCLFASFEYSFCSTTDQLFPLCGKCGNGNRCQPSDPGLKDKMISQILIGGSPKIKARNKFNPVHRDIKAQERPKSPLFIPEPLHDVTSKIGSRKLKALSANGSMSGSQLLNHVLRGSVISGISSVVSSVPKSSPAVDQIVEKSTSGTPDVIPNALLRSYFTQMLLCNFPDDFTEWEIDAKFGPLRLVDKLMYSEDGKTYQHACCFLFTNALLIAPILQDSTPGNSLDLKLERFTVFCPIADITVTTIDSSLLQCTILNQIADTKLVHGVTLYLTEELNSSASNVIQKWISALLDFTIVFNHDTFSATLFLPAVAANMWGSNSSLCVTNERGSKLQYVDEHDSEVIVRRSLVTSETGQNHRATITSILSLKRERPESLIVVLQLSFRYLNDSDTLIIRNSLKALTFKFPGARMCVVDALGRIVTYGAINDNLSEIGKAQEDTNCSSRAKFTPELLKSWQNTDSDERLAIAIFSNSPMEEGKSCLFMDYKVFANENRREANELKVRVGCLNFDYADKIHQLVEIASWSNLLEIACYSFNFSFDEEDSEDSDRSSEDEDEVDDRVDEIQMEFGSTETSLVASSDSTSSSNEVRENSLSARNQTPLYDIVSPSDLVPCKELFLTSSSNSGFSPNLPAATELLQFDCSPPLSGTVSPSEFLKNGINPAEDASLLHLEELRWSSFFDGISKALDDAIQRQKCSKKSPECNSESLSINFL
ncbi:LAFE_0H09824g1_1 [Lachancea fermentati]|uniref:LAFE_0H09824g1_1 n=1 Tax=Lachancea fermentati TaxID=4955 RepID=A0A1G4MK69_LACFM|nr:LAFE_0H09824g1_1 [Lachancea fermentati]